MHRRKIETVCSKQNPPWRRDTMSHIVKIQKWMNQSSLSLSSSLSPFVETNWGSNVNVVSSYLTQTVIEIMSWMNTMLRMKPIVVVFACLLSFREECCSSLNLSVLLCFTPLIHKYSWLHRVRVHQYVNNLSQCPDNCLVNSWLPFSPR